jgi:lipopolysaccharide export system permease protein
LKSKLFRHYFWYFTRTIILFLLGFLVLIFLADFTDNLRKFSKFDVSIFTVLWLSLLKLPRLVIDVSPFIVLFASFFCIRSSVLKREVDIIKAAGLSIWQFLVPFLVVALLWGIFIIFIVTSISVLSINHYNTLENNIRQSSGKVEFKNSGSNLWLIDRLSDTEENIILAKDNKIINNSNTLINIVLFELINNQVMRIISAESATINKNSLNLNKVLIKNNASDYAESLDNLSINFSINRKISSLSAIPEQIYVWQLPSMIGSLNKVRLDTRPYTNYFYNLLLLPFLLVSIVLVSTRFSLYDVRSSKHLFPIAIMLLFGFMIYIFIKLLSTISTSGVIPPLVASLIGHAIILSFTINLIFSKERL